MSDVDRRNLSCDLVDWAIRQPDAPALLLPDRTLSYRQLDALTWKYARLLAGGGVRPGRVVGLSLASEPRFALVMLACIRLGATVHALAPGPAGSNLSPPDGIDPDLLATDRPPARGPRDVPVIAVNSDAIAAMAEGPEPGLMPQFPDAPWQLVVGSGTTGRPKVMAITHAQQRARARIAAGYRGLASSDRFLAMPSLDYSYARTLMCIALSVGGSFGLVDRNPARIAETCRRHRFTMVDATVFHVESMLAALQGTEDRRPDPALPTVRSLTMSSSTVGDDLRRRIRASLTPNLAVLYGANEVSTIAAARPPEVWEVPGTVGRLVPGVEVRILGADGLPAAPGAPGILEVRSPALIDGYVGDPEATAKAFRQGWFSTGDLILVREDGQLVYCGRGDHMMILNGINIYPEEIERVLDAHPDVSDVAVMPISHRTYQDIPVCAVALRAGAAASVDELTRFAADRLGPRRPRAIVVLDRIPRNEQGKLIRASLQEILHARVRAAAGDR